MKLNDLSTRRQRRIPTSEGVLDQLVQAMKIGAQLPTVNKPTDGILLSLVERAKLLPTTLFEPNDDVVTWWSDLMDHYSIPDSRRKDCVAITVDRIKPIIDAADGDASIDWQSVLAHATNRRKLLRLLKKVMASRGNITEGILDRIRGITQSSQGGLNDYVNKAYVSAANEMIALLAIHAAKNYAERLQGLPPEEQQVAQPVEQPKPRPQARPTRPVDPENQNKAKELAVNLWRMTRLRATGKGTLTPQTAQQYVEQIKKLGFRIDWQGVKRADAPNGDRPPDVVPL